MKKFIIGVVIVGLVGFGAYFILKTPAKAPGTQNTNITPPPTDGGVIPQGETVTISMTDTGYSPATLNMKMGTTVIFKNDGENEHWPASAMHPTHTVYPGSNIEKCNTPDESKIFDACRGISKGSSWSFQFNNKGIWRYHDHLYPKLFGSITVE
ncbi:MAG: hypothetical protein AAB482_00235 [Patescibacteria group bacterium]